VGTQFHFHPQTYLAMVRAEVPDYDVVQDVIARATAGVDARAILDLGTGTGITAERVLALHPGARLTGIDSSPEMLDHARSVLPRGEFRVARLEDPLPAGPFDLVISALAIHHLDGAGKADLVGRVAAVLGPGGRFVFGDVVVPEDPADTVTPIDGDFDQPSTVDEHMGWLSSAGLEPMVVWRRRDLAVVAADKRA
jgi:tRNA (cmo5U34)-methyltransferase